MKKMNTKQLEQFIHDQLDDIDKRIAKLEEENKKLYDHINRLERKILEMISRWYYGN